MPTLDPRILPDFLQAPVLAVSGTKIFRPESKVFTMGSCFAYELRKALKQTGSTVFPDYVGIPLDKKTQIFDLRGFEMPPHLNTFVMRQEFEAAASMWPDRNLGYSPVENETVNNFTGWPIAYHDPYRKLS